MDFWIFVLAVLGVILLFPYLRFFLKRVRLYGSLRVLCKTKNYRIHATHPLWMFGRNGRTDCDFCIETDSAVYAVKLFRTKYRSTHLIFTENGNWFIRFFSVHFAHGSHVAMPIDSKPRCMHAYNFKTNYADAWYKKIFLPVLLINPVCREVKRQNARGDEETIGSGDTVGGMFVYSLSRFLDRLSYDADF